MRSREWWIAEARGAGLAFRYSLPWRMWHAKFRWGCAYPFLGLLAVSIVGLITRSAAGFYLDWTLLAALIAAWLWTLWVVMGNKWGQRSWRSVGLEEVTAGFDSRLASNVRTMSWVEFEQALAGLFLALGHERVETTPGSGDFGADVVVDGGTDHAIVVQAKYWEQRCGVHAIQEVAAARAHYGAPRAICIAPGGFTVAAVRLAGSTGVECWDQEHLATEVERAARLRSR